MRYKGDGDAQHGLSAEKTTRDYVSALRLYLRNIPPPWVYKDARVGTVAMLRSQMLCFVETQIRVWQKRRVDYATLSTRSCTFATMHNS